MSMKFNLKDLNRNIIENIQKHLIIKPIPTIKNPFVNKFAKKKNYEYAKKDVLIELFDIIENINNLKSGPIIYLPFSYVFHHICSENQYPNDNIEYKQIEYKFEGNLLDRQKDIEEQTFEILNRTHSVLLSLFTGFGKTIYAIYLLSKLKLKTIILSHRIVIMEQWIDALKKYLPNSKFAIADGSKPLKDDIDIYIINISNIPKRERDEYSKYGLLIIDEAHCFNTETYSMSLFYLQPKYIIALSATPERTDGMDHLMTQFVGPEHIIKKMYRLFNCYRVFTKWCPDTQTNSSGNLDWNDCLEQQSGDTKRNEIICKLIRYFRTKNIMILVKRKNHAVLLKKMLICFGENDDDIELFFGSKKGYNDKCRVLISTFQKSGIGFNAPNLNMLIVGADVEEQFIQYLGRIFRTDDDFPIMIDLVDKFKPMYNHSKSRCDIAKNLGGEIKNFKDYFPDVL